MESFIDEYILERSKWDETLRTGPEGLRPTFESLKLDSVERNDNESL